MAVIGNLYRQKAEQRNSPPWPSHYVRALDALLERGMGSGFLNGSFYQDGVYNFTREYNGRNVAWMAVERTENAATGEERWLRTCASLPTRPQ